MGRSDVHAEFCEAKKISFPVTLSQRPIKRAAEENAHSPAPVFLSHMSLHPLRNTGHYPL